MLSLVKSQFALRAILFAGYRALFSAGLIFSLSSCSASSPELKGQQAPLTRFTLLEDGSPLLLSELRGKTSVIAFWAVWCPQSKPTIAELNALARQVRGSRSDVEFVAASVDAFEDESKMMSKVRDSNWDSITFAFSGNESYDEAFMAFQTEEIPRLYVISPEGVVTAEGRSVSSICEAIPGAECA